MFRIILTLIWALYALTGYNSTFFLHPVNGTAIPFANLQGKWVFINYWASWCDTCLDEIVELNCFFAKNKNKIALFAVNYDMLPIESLLALIKKHKINYPSLQEDPAASLSLAEIHSVPTTFVFNPQGQLQVTLYGEQTCAGLNAIINT